MARCSTLSSVKVCGRREQSWSTRCLGEFCADDNREFLHVDKNFKVQYLLSRKRSCRKKPRSISGDNFVKLILYGSSSQVNQVAFNAVCQAHTVTMQCSLKSYKNT